MSGEDFSNGFTNHRKQLKYHERALAIARKVGDKEWEIIELGQLGDTYVDLDNAQQAIRYYEQALTMLGKSVI